jgi:hypothetical protein
LLYQETQRSSEEEEKELTRTGDKVYQEGGPSEAPPSPNSNAPSSPSTNAPPSPNTNLYQETRTDENDDGSKDVTETQDKVYNDDLLYDE